MFKPEDEYKQLVQLAADIRTVVFDDAVDWMQVSMVSSPIECIAFALEWIKREKVMSYDHRLFAEEF